MKKLSVVVCVVFILLSLTMCGKAEKPDLYEDGFNNEYVSSDETKYIMTFEIKQSHFTLDLGEHLKDSANKISIPVMVDKDYYDYYEIGDTVKDDFRMGSFIFKGSYGKWKVTVKDKQEIKAT